MGRCPCHCPQSANPFNEPVAIESFTSTLITRNMTNWLSQINCNLDELGAVIGGRRPHWCCDPYGPINTWPSRGQSNSPWLLQYGGNYWLGDIHPSSEEYLRNGKTEKQVGMSRAVEAVTAFFLKAGKFHVSTINEDKVFFPHISIVKYNSVMMNYALHRRISDPCNFSRIIDTRLTSKAALRNWYGGRVLM